MFTSPVITFRASRRCISRLSGCQTFCSFRRNIPTAYSSRNASATVLAWSVRYPSVGYFIIYPSNLQGFLLVVFEVLQTF